MIEDSILFLIILFGGMICFIVIAIMLAMRDMDKQHKEMLSENEEYYQKMQSGKENNEGIS